MNKGGSLKKNGFYAFISCMALMIVLNTDLSSITVEAVGNGFWERLALIIKKFEYLLPVFTYRDGILAFMTFYFFMKSEEEWPSKIHRGAYRIPAALTSFFVVFGYSFQYTNSWNLLIMDTFHCFVTIWLLSGFYLLFARIYSFCTGRLIRYEAEKELQCGKLTEWIFEKHSFLGPFLVILLFWSPYIIAKYPGAAMPETLAEMRQYYWHSINNYYPPLHTIAMSLIMELGNLLVSYTFGFFLNLAVQLGLLISAFAYGFHLMKRWRTPYLLRYLAIAIICIVQFFPMEATVVEKDIPYAACVIFYVLMLYELVRTLKQEGTCSGRQMLGTILCSFGIAGFRNEGIFLVLNAGVAASIYAYCHLWKRDRKRCLRILTALLLPVLLFVMYQKLLQPICGVEDNGPKEALSIPFQQTARYVRDYGYELTEEDEEIIGAVLDIENLGELYDPVTSDPVKYTYHAENAQELWEYFGLWFRQLLRHPGSAVQATMNNAYGWFYREGYAHNYMMSSQIEGQEVRWEIRQPEALAGYRQIIERLAKLLSRIPLVNWFENPGFVSWMTILLIALWTGSGRKKYLLSITPLIVALLVCVAAPTFNFQMRYIMPVMFCVPYYIPMFLQSLRE